MSDTEPDTPSKAERHLAAILAADIVGYSGQMERDEVGTLSRLRDLRNNLMEPKVVEHRGRIFKTTGDGFLAEFVSVLEAVHCAVDIQRLISARNLDLAVENQVLLRMGINLGDVFHEGDDVFGDGVNIAARLEGIAPPGGIYISRAACDPIRDRFAFDFQDLGERQVKNISRPIHVFGIRLEGAPLHDAHRISTGMRRRRLRGPALIGLLGCLGVISLMWLFLHEFRPNLLRVHRPSEPATANVVKPSQSTTDQRPTEPPQQTLNEDSVFWLSISGSSNASDFEEYLKKYPEGRYAGLARNRITALRIPAPPAAPVSTPPPTEIEANLTTDQRREVQRALGTLGHFQGEADGAFGVGTQIAIKQFQSFSGAPETGTLNRGERKTLLEMAQRLAALFDQPATSPEGVAGVTIKDAAGRYAHAYRFEAGKGPKADPAEAAYWYALAAADGEPKAFINFGRLLVRGWGTTQPDPNDAALLWWAAAARGEPSAMFNEGLLYERGIGVTADLARAREWYERAAALNDSRARDALKRLGS